MDLKEMSAPLETTTATILKPATVIANTISREYLEILELKEFCKIVESDLKEYESKVEMLTFSNSESAKIKAEYKRRNKINKTNSESLLQSKNELYKYKCELKSNYIATEKALKLRKLRYKRIISSYESDWQKTLNEFNSNSMVLELQTIKEENNFLEMTMKKQEKMNNLTEKQFTELTECVQNMLLNKIIQFSESVIRYREFANSQRKNINTLLNVEPNSGQSFGFRLFGNADPFNKKKFSSPDANDDGNCFLSSDVIDISLFDDVTIPAENLESQQLEEDSILSPETIREHSNDNYKEEEENAESSNRNEQTEERGGEKLLIAGGEGMEISGKIGNEIESEYFRPESSKQNRIDLKPREVSAFSLEENDEEFRRERQMEFEENLSDGSGENQFGIQREIYDRNFGKTCSFSSDDFPPVDNTNEDSKSPEQTREEKNKQETGKNTFHSLSGFFTMEDDQNSQKPLIFKLF